MVMISNEKASGLSERREGATMFNLTNFFVIARSAEGYYLDMEPLITANFLFTVLLGAGLVIFFYSAGHIWEWICRKLDERKRDRKK